MNEKYFNDNVIKCKKCASVPTLVKEVKSDSFINGKDEEVRYKVVCLNCKWENGSGSCETRACKSAEGALKSWNKKMS